MSSFNRILTRFRDAFRCPHLAACATRVEDVARRLQRRGLPVRIDSSRSWEYALVLDELGRNGPPTGGLLDVGGGGSPLAYALAEEGRDVTVLEVDRDVVREVNAVAGCLGLGERMRAVYGEPGAWPLDPSSFDAAVSVSVFESILRRHRPAFWRELRRTLRPRAPLLLTFDFGPEACYLGDAPADLAEVRRDLVEASGMLLDGPLPPEPRFDPDLGPPVKAIVPTLDGHDQRAIAYTFAALRLENPG